MMSALIDYNTLNLTDCQHEAIKQLKEVMRNGKFLVVIVYFTFKITFNLSVDHPSVNIQQDNYFLTKYLIANEWNVQEAARKIINFYRLKATIISLFICLVLFDQSIQS